MKAKKTLIAIITACMIAGCSLGHRTIYGGGIGDKKVKYEKVYSASLGYEPDYKMTVSFANGDVWIMTDNNMDGMMKPGDDVVEIMKDGGTIRYRGITPLTLPIMLEADKLYQSMLEGIKNKKSEPISNKEYTN